MLEILERITQGKGEEGDIEKLETLAENIKSSALCGLGQSAPNPVLTTIRYFRDEYDAHIRDKKCPAKQCKPLLTYSIDAEKCIGCTSCARKCPAEAISGEKKKPHAIDPAKCIKCGLCLTNCRFGAVERH
jgi:NAD-dependent dihydropyrimidine dehydrogenase PreA subunit